MSGNMMPCGCNEAVELETYSVCAGKACDLPEAEGDLNCGNNGVLVQLPQVHVLEQSYVYGFTPEEALSRGTMFPELVN